MSAPTTIRLVGFPAVFHGEEVAPVRGKKTWALLGRILISDRPLSRRQLAAEVFPEADDPMGALRWSLSQARRALGCSDCLSGDPVVAGLPAGVVVDVWDRGFGVADVVALDGALLDGIDGSWSVDFDMWLAVERGRVESQLIAALHHEAEVALARDDLVRAVAAGQQLVRRAPLDESSHVMLIRALARSGEAAAARDGVRACEETLRGELGCEPTAAVYQAARSTDIAGRSAVPPGASARALLEAGAAALDAGVIDAGVLCLRQAVSGAEGGSDVPLAATAWCALGSALVHSTRGADDEGRVALRRAADLALQVDDVRTEITSLTELGYAAALAGRRLQAEESFDRATDLAAAMDHDPGEDPRPGLLGFAAFNQSDWGRGQRSISLFREAIERAEADGQVRPLAFALTLGSRPLADAGDTAEASRWLARAQELISEERWLSFRPLVRCFGHELELQEGRAADLVRRDVEETYGHSCQLGDPCWEAAAARVLGLTWGAEHAEEAFSWFAKARARAASVNDTWSWVHSAALDSELQVALDIGDGDRARAAARQLLEHAIHRQLDGFVDRAAEVLGPGDRATVDSPSPVAT